MVVEREEEGGKEGKRKRPSFETDGAEALPFTGNDDRERSEILTRTSLSSDNACIFGMGGRDFEQKRKISSRSNSTLRRVQSTRGSVADLWNPFQFSYREDEP